MITKAEKSVKKINFCYLHLIILKNTSVNETKK